MFNIGAGEMVFILIAALLVLGPTRLPELARGIGKFLREFRRQTDEVRNVVVREFYAMDEEVQRAPPPPTAAPLPAMPSILAPAPVPPAEQVMVSPAEHPQAVAAALGETAQAGGPVEPSPGIAPEPSAPHEEPLPRFDSLPGTVARNAPKQG
jgi:sec-independent protein translocase protein TatB